MMKLKKYFLFSIVVFCFYPSSSASQSKKQDPETRIKELGIHLRTPGPPSANFIGSVRVGKMVYLSGQGPLKADGTYMIGKVGDEFNLEQAQDAARLTGVSLLQVLK